jgi:AcrR family transcriptional regulator
MPKVVPEYKEDAKRRIIDAAMEVMAERGCELMAVDDVAKKLGVTKGAVYWYFPSREALIEAVIVSICGTMQKMAFESYYNRPLEETLIRIFDNYAVKDERQRKIFFEMFVLATRHSDVRHATREYYAGFISSIEDAITNEKKKNFLRPQADAHELAVLIVALYSGLQNYDMVWMYQDEIRKLWLDGVRILLKPSYTGTYGEEKK